MRATQGTCGHEGRDQRAAERPARPPRRRREPGHQRASPGDSSATPAHVQPVRRARRCAGSTRAASTSASTATARLTKEDPPPRRAVEQRAAEHRPGRRRQQHRHPPARSPGPSGPVRRSAPGSSSRPAVTSPPPRPGARGNAISVPTDHAAPHSTERPGLTDRAHEYAPRRRTGHGPTRRADRPPPAPAGTPGSTALVVDSRGRTPPRAARMATFTIVASRIVITAPQTTTAAAASTGRPRSRIPPHILAGARHPRTARK